MSPPDPSPYHFSWPYIIEQDSEGKCLYLGHSRKEYGSILSQTFDDVFVGGREDMKKTVENFPHQNLDLIILDNPCQIDRASIRNLKSLLSLDGRLVVRADGFGRSKLVCNVLGLHEGKSATSLADVIRLLKGNSDRLGLVSKYAIVSSYERETSFIVDLDSADAIEWLVGLGGEPGADTLIEATTEIAKRANEMGLLKFFLPGFAFVFGSSNYSASRFDVQKSTVNRSILLNFNSGDLANIRKIPVRENRAFVDREIHVMNSTRSSLEGELKQTVPYTEWREKNGRGVIHEVPVNGYSISAYYNRDIESLSKAVKIPFEWLREVSAENITHHDSLSVEEYSDMLCFDGEDYTMATDPSEELSYPVSPCHGDFFGPNILTDSKKVTGVIDWEWGGIKESPIVDAWFYILQLAETLFSDLSEGIHNLLVQENQISDIVWDEIKKLCSHLHIPIREFVYYLPYPYVRRARIQKRRYGEYEQSWLNKAADATSISPTVLWQRQ